MVCRRQTQHNMSQMLLFPGVCSRRLNEETVRICVNMRDQDNGAEYRFVVVNATQTRTNCRVSRRHCMQTYSIVAPRRW